MASSIGDDRTMVRPDGGNESSKASITPGGRLGQYKVISLLGRGGMGEVYEVEHTVLRRRYALKLLPADFASRSEALARFKQEAEVMASLDHRNIVRVDDFGETDGLYWLRMELANGGRCNASAPKGRHHRSQCGASAPKGRHHRSQCNASAPKGRDHRSPGLSDSATLGSDIDNELCPEGAPQSSVIVRSLAEYAEAKGGRLSPDEAQVIFTQILEGLAHAHQHGVIHRDLKPANILIFADEDGNATFKISDFGLVRMVGEEWVRSQADQSIRLSMSMSMGQQATMLPEGGGQFHPVSDRNLRIYESGTEARRGRYRHQ